MRNLPLLLTVALALYGAFRLYEDVSNYRRLQSCNEAGREWNYQFGGCE